MQKVPWKNSELLEWIRTSGFPLEYRLAQHIKAKGKEPILNLQVECYKEDIVREIDVCFDVYDRPNSHKSRFFIECKYTKNPWVALSGFPQPVGAFELDSFPRTSNAGKFWSNKQEFAKAERHLMDNQYFGPTLITSNSLHEPSKNKKDRQDTPYKTLKKIVLSAEDFAENCNCNGSILAFTCIPCIVISNDLYLARWDDKLNDFTLRKTDMIRLYWMGTGITRSVLVSTMEWAEQFCDTLTNMGDCINQLNAHRNP